MRKMPSLRSMHYFEAVARHASFTEASKELCVSQAAVSHQIKLLEQQLGTSMISRTTRQFALTKRGEALFVAVTEALNILSDATTRIRSSLEAESGHLKLSVTPFFSAHWLLPRLPQFSNSNARAQVNLHHSQQQPLRQTLGESDASQAFIMYGDGNWEGFQADYLFSADLVPMCSPTLLGGAHTLKNAEEILNYPLVHEFSYEWWGRWFELSGVRRPAVNFGPIIDDPNVLIGAALGLQGMVLGPPLFYKDHIKAGLLVTPVGSDIRIPIDYYLIIPTETLISKNIRQFRNWLLRQSETYHMSEPDSLPRRRQEKLSKT